MEIKSLDDLIFLFRLYTVKGGTLKELSELGGFKYASGKIFRLRDMLVERGILFRNGARWRPKGGAVCCYRVNHKRLDDFFIREFPTYFIYQRTVNGPINVFPFPAKPDKKELAKWIDVRGI